MWDLHAAENYQMLARAGRLCTESNGGTWGADTGIFNRGRPVRLAFVPIRIFNDLASITHKVFSPGFMIN